MLIVFNLLFNVVLSVVVWNKMLDMPDASADMVGLATFWVCLNILTALKLFQVRK